MELLKYSITFSSPTDCSPASGLLLLLLLLLFWMFVSVWSFSNEVLFSSFYSIFFFILFISLRRICVFFFSLAHLSTFIHLHPTCCVIVSIVWFDSLAFRMTFYTNASLNHWMWCRLCNNKENFPSNFLCSTVVHIIKNDAATNVESTEEAYSVVWFHHSKFVFS